MDINGIIISFKFKDIVIYELYEYGMMEQENPYHLEGKLSNHIEMVVKQVKMHNPSNELLIAALFHDIGKIKVKKHSEEKGWYVYHGHEKVSEEMFREIYEQYNLDKQEEIIDLEHVCYLIRNHHKIDNLQQYLKHPRRIKSQAILDSPHLSELILLRKCDGLGRIPQRKGEIK